MITTCDICGEDVPLNEDYFGCCPKCGQEYRFDEGVMIVLTPHQLGLLLADKKLPADN